ncbi:apolipoprotein A-I precursor [Silurus asotus]|uniref:Apolipoprotein A-I n=1 Tax=Silurus asotus TaxID=30991 RepID=A0AAD5B2V3_SILAS|nr:apolipoprotein A-I precursor [Silurus asotus]
MKFVALALAVLLAAGCQARFLQADAPPSQYEHIRSAVVTYLGQVKDTAQKAIGHLDDAEFKDYKARLTQGLENIETMLKSSSESLAPFREGLGPQIVESFSGVRERISNDLEELRKELEPKREQLRQVIKKHLEEYRAKLEPLLKEYSEKNRKQVDEFKAKFEPVIKELQEKIRVNVEETKSKLTPIVETIRNKLTKGLEELKATFGPHAQEYREQIEGALNDLKKKYESGELQAKLQNLGEELRPQLINIYSTIEKSLRS